jgi:hypothetical protein
MPSIRFPASAVSLLTLCKGHGENFIFRTNADLIAFVASYGYYLVTYEGHKLPLKPAFVATPDAVSMEVFENRNLYANFLIIALAVDDTRQVAEDETMLAKLIEQFAFKGAEQISNQLADCDYTQMLTTMVSLIQQERDSVKI